MDQEISDRLAIRDLIEKWVIYRDSGDFERFASLWHDDGYMMTTWFEAPAREFLERSRRAFEAGSEVLHVLGGAALDLAGMRAIAQTKMEILQRALVHDVLVDVRCQGRFYDFLEKRDGKWGLVLRQPIYELDHLWPVDPAAKVELNAELLASFPKGYRHLAYLQSCMGFTVRKDLPGTRGPEIEALYARGKRWLSGQPIG